MSESAGVKRQHWPTILLGLIVAAVFLVAIFSFQVKSTEWAVVTTFGKIDGVREGGLHFRLPYPIQNIIKFDNRLRCFDGSVGKIEETFTKDGKNILIGIYVIYKISDPSKFYKTVVTIPDAEDRLNSLMRTMKDGVIGTYNFDQIINTDPKKMLLNEIEAKIKDGIAAVADKQYGLSIQSVGVKSVGLPESITEKVCERMINERKVVAAEYRAEGKKKADTIKYEADNMKSRIITDAQAQAKTIRAQGDAEAASYYSAFRKNPELAAFLRKLDSLRKIMGSKTTVVLDTDSVPFDLLKMDSSGFGGKDDEKESHAGKPESKKQ
jgi:membrane protease subunit HflC